MLKRLDQELMLRYHLTLHADMTSDVAPMTWLAGWCGSYGSSRMMWQGHATGHNSVA